MKMKKLLALLLALIMVFALAACGNDDANMDDDDDDEGKKESTSATTAPAGDPTDPPIVTPTDPPIVTPTDPPIVTPTDPPETQPTAPSETRPTGTPVSPLEQQILGSWETTVSVDPASVGQADMVGTFEMNITFTFNADGTAVMHIDKDAYLQNIVDLIVENLYAQLGGEEVAEQAFQATMNMSCREYAQAAVDSMADSLDMEDVTQDWSLNGNSLTLGKQVMTVSIDGDELTMTGNEELEVKFGTDTLILNRI